MSPESPRYNEPVRDNGAITALTVQPTTKFLKAGALLAGLIFLGLEIMCLYAWNDAVGSRWIMLPPILILLWPAARALRWRFTKATISGDRLRY